MNEIAKTDAQEIMEAVLIKGDLSKLTPDERNRYYIETCKSIGLNPLTKPFDYLNLGGKLIMYAKRDAADQLRKLHGINIQVVKQEHLGDLFCVTVRATDKTGRIDEDMGCVAMPTAGAGEIRANLMLKGITKAKRRVTLSICGLGFLDETEVEDIPSDQKRMLPRQTKIKPSEPDMGDHDLVYDDPNPGVGTSQGGDGAPVPSSALHNAGASAVLSDIETQLLDGLGSAAKKGSLAFKHEWNALHKKYQAALRQKVLHKLESYKKIAQMVDAKNGEKSETML